MLCPTPSAIMTLSKPWFYPLSKYVQCSTYAYTSTMGILKILGMPSPISKVFLLSDCNVIPLVAAVTAFFLCLLSIFRHISSFALTLGPISHSLLPYMILCLPEHYPPPLRYALFNDMKLQALAMESTSVFTFD